MQRSEFTDLYFTEVSQHNARIYEIKSVEVQTLLDDEELEVVVGFQWHRQVVRERSSFRKT